MRSPVATLVAMLAIAQMFGGGNAQKGFEWIAESRYNSKTPEQSLQDKGPSLSTLQAEQIPAAAAAPLSLHDVRILGEQPAGENLAPATPTPSDITKADPWDLSNAEQLGTSSNRNVAVCLTGTTVDPDITAPSLRDNVLKELDADLFFHTTDSSPESAINMYREGGHLRSVRVIPDSWKHGSYKGSDEYMDSLAGPNNAVWKQHFLEATARPESNFFSGVKLDFAECHYLDAFNHKCKSASGQPLDASSPECTNCLHHCNCMATYVHQYGCKLMIEREEKLRGRSYDRIMWTRSDMKFSYKHPSIDLLGKTEKALGTNTWVISSRSNFGGLCDHYLFGPRDITMGVLGALKPIARNEGMGVSLLQQSQVDVQTNGELAFKMILDSLNARVAPLPDFAARSSRAPTDPDQTANNVYAPYLNRCGWSSEHIIQYSKNANDDESWAASENSRQACSIPGKVTN